MRPAAAAATAHGRDPLHEIARPDPARDEIIGDGHMDAGALAGREQHLHGGAGVDRDYLLHRYFLWSKSNELTFGAAMPQLARLGRDMARTGPQELA